MLPSSREGGLTVLRAVTAKTNAQIVMFSARQNGMTEIVDQARSIGVRRFIDKEIGGFLETLEIEINDMLIETRSNIFISFGWNEVLKIKLKDFLRDSLHRKILILEEQPDLGKTVIEKLEAASLRCSSAIILMSADDLQIDGGVRARQNVVHELGFFQGKYGRDRVILLVEKGVEICSNISGIVRIEFDKAHFEECFERVRINLDSMK
jgi:predicted nucleotide-binding protein